MIIPAPTPTDKRSMKRVVQLLRENGFTERGCAERLGIQPVNGVRWAAAVQHGIKQLVHTSADELDILIALFQGNIRIPVATVLHVFSSTDLSALERMGLVVVDSKTAYSPFNVFPCLDSYIVTDLREQNPDINQVMWLFPESFLLAHLIDRSVRLGSALDVCTGSGIHAILASPHCCEVVGTDISPRAISFARFNALLNGLSNVDFRLGDVYDTIGDQRFDLIVANPPYNPSRLPPASNYYSGGPSGEAILSRVIRGLPTHLTPVGMGHIITLLIHHHGVDYRDKVEGWLGTVPADFDVIIQSVDVSSSYAKMLKAAGLDPDEFARIEFGTISFCRAAQSGGGSFNRVMVDNLGRFDQSGVIGHKLTRDSLKAITAGHA
jgi:carbamoyltransferase